MKGYDERLITAYKRSTDSIVADLRHLADSVEQAAVPSDRLSAPFTSSASRITSLIVNTLPNLNLPLMHERAAECEYLFRTSEGGEQR